MRVRIAASVGPYGAVLADGSEYTGAYAIGTDELRNFHRDRLAALADTGPDLFAVETIPSAAEAQAIVDAMANLGHRVAAWMCFSASSDTSTCAGDAIEDAAAIAASSPAVEAIGINCTAPRHVAGLLRRIATVTDLPLVAYPNRGATWDPVGKQWHDPEPAPTAAMIQDWVSAGARWIGGCCGYDAADIAGLGDVVRGRLI